MASDSTKKSVRRSIRHQRRRRALTGVHVVTAIILAAAVMVMLNVVVAGFPYRWRLTSHVFASLSEKTRDVLHGVEANISVVAFLPADTPLARMVRELLKEYQHEAGRSPTLTLSLEMVDPGRDLARTRQLAREYDVTDEYVVVFDCEGRRKQVGLRELADYDVRMSERGPRQELAAFKGEQAFSSAILSVVHSSTPMVCFTQGHGEKEIGDYHEHDGYSDIARIIRQDNMDVRAIELAASGGVPDDCSILAIAGPQKSFSKAECDMISDFLVNRHGRLLLMIDPATTTGLEPLLADWGVQLGSGVAAGLTVSGQELVVRNYGDHPITEKISRLTTVFYRPRPVGVRTSPSETPDVVDDRARVTVLAGTGNEGWEEFDFQQSPPLLDRETDRPGPISIAVAVEKGARGVDVEIAPTRMVVFGDSLFVSNASLSKGIGGNVSFFMSAMNWLVERDALLSVQPQAPFELRLNMSRQQKTMAFLLMVVFVPAVFALFGGLVCLKRRR